MKRLAYTIAECRTVVPIGKTKIFELIRAGSLKTVKIGRRTLITAASLHALVKSSEPDDLGDGTALSEANVLFKEPVAYGGVDAEKLKVVRRLSSRYLS